MTATEEKAHRLHPYPSYKDSGVEWIGEIPKAWETRPIKSSFQIQLGKMLQPEPSALAPQEIPYLRAANVQWEHIQADDIKTMYASPAEQRVFGLKKDDLLILEGGDIGRSALVGAEHEHLIIQNSLHRIRPTSGVAHYLLYVMQHIKSTGILDVLCNKATIQHLTGEKLANLPMPTPPAQEQRAIAAFLDRETARIDELIREQEALLDDLSDKRQATITHAVTKGLDASATMKPSGVEWIGEIPTGWETRPIKASFQIQLGKMLQPEPSPLAPQEVPYLRAANVQWEDIRTDDIKTMYASPTEQRVFGLKKGDLLILEGGDIGRSALVGAEHEHLIIQNSLHRIRPTSGVAHYLLYVMQHIKSTGILDVLCNKATIQHLTGEKLANLPMPTPPAEEQQAIAAYLDEQLAQIDELREEVRANIEDMRIHRSALITAAVTGKIDVRPEAE